MVTSRALDIRITILQEYDWPKKEVRNPWRRGKAAKCSQLHRRVSTDPSTVTVVVAHAYCAAVGFNDWRSQEKYRVTKVPILYLS